MSARNVCFDVLRRMIGLIAAAALLAGCVRTGIEAPGARHSWTTPHVLRLADVADPDSLDPLLSAMDLSYDLSSLVFSYLTIADRDGKPIGDLAIEEPTAANRGISPDGRTYTYHLRKGVFWHDGVRFGSRDVAFSWRTIMSSYNNVLHREGYEEVRSIDTPDANTVVVHLRRRYPSFASEFFTGLQEGAKPIVPIGETVVTREPDSASRSVNGAKVAGHLSDGRLELLRERDGATVRWDVRDKALIDYGYAVTSFRSQGRTVDGSYVLATQADAQRGLYVDVTRARKRVAIAYGRDDLHDFGRLLDVGARERAKLTIAGLERYLTKTRQQKVEEKLTMAQTGPTTSGASPRAATTGPTRATSHRRTPAHECRRTCSA